MEIQVFHDDRVRRVLQGDFYDKPCSLYRDCLVDTSGQSPQTGHFPGTMTLRVAYFAQSMLQRVFLARQFEKVPADDSAIRKHSRANACAVDAKINRDNCLLIYCFFGFELHLLAKGKG